MEALRQDDPRRFGPYTTLARVRESAVAVHFLARGADRDGLAVVTAARPALASVPAFRRRFRSEARTAERLAGRPGSAAGRLPRGRRPVDGHGLRARGDALRSDRARGSAARARGAGAGRGSGRDALPGARVRRRVPGAGSGDGAGGGGRPPADRVRTSGGRGQRRGPRGRAVVRTPGLSHPGTGRGPGGGPGLGPLRTRTAAGVRGHGDDPARRRAAWRRRPSGSHTAPPNSAPCRSGCAP